MRKDRRLLSRRLMDKTAIGRKLSHHKLHSQAGESIAETLIALLISSLALIMLAGAISASVRVIERSKSAIEEYYQGNNVVSSQGSPQGSLSVSFTSSAFGGGQPVLFTDADFIYVDYYLNDRLGRYPVVSYRLQEGSYPEVDPSDEGGFLP